MQIIEEAFDSAAAAIGWSASEECVPTDYGRTTNPGLMVQGFTVAYTVLDQNGVKWTAHYDHIFYKYKSANQSSGKLDVYM